MRPLLPLALVLAAAAGLPIFGAGAEIGAPNGIAAASPSPAAAPPMDDIDGRRWTLDGLRGRVVLLDFWATWCAPCLSELPRIKHLRERYSRDDLEIIGVMIEAGSRRTLISWLNRHRIHWPQVHERSYSGPVARAYGVRSLPATVLFRRDGSLDETGLRGDRLAQRVAELVGGEER
jgi:thiol-disulfide isomerase/thioredoxin